MPAPQAGDYGDYQQPLEEGEQEEDGQPETSAAAQQRARRQTRNPGARLRNELKRKSLAVGAWSADLAAWAAHVPVCLPGASPGAAPPRLPCSWRDPAASPSWCAHTAWRSAPTHALPADPSNGLREVLPGVRRSGRQKTEPLKWWLNEKKEFGREHQ